MPTIYGGPRAASLRNEAEEMGYVAREENTLHKIEAFPKDNDLKSRV